MRIQLYAFCIIISIISCSKSADEGFLGEWEGKTTIIFNGNPVLSETSAKIIDKGGMTRECEVFSDALTYQFDATESDNLLIYYNAIPKNISDTLMKTYISGEAKLIGDTLLIFDHEVVTKKESTVISSIDYYLEFKRK